MTSNIKRKMEKGKGKLTSAFDIADDRAGGIVHELDAHLRHTSSGACATRSLVSFAVDFWGREEKEKEEEKKEQEKRVKCTGTTEHSGHFDELDGDFSGIHVPGRYSLMYCIFWSVEMLGGMRVGCGGMSRGWVRCTFR